MFRRSRRWMQHTIKTTMPFRMMKNRHRFGMLVVMIAALSILLVALQWCKYELEAGLCREWVNKAAKPATDIHHGVRKFGFWIGKGAPMPESDVLVENERDKSSMSKGSFLSKLSRQQTRLVKMNYEYMMYPSLLTRRDYPFDAVQELRKDVVGKVCRSLDEYPYGYKPPIPGHLLVDDNHHVIFCQVRKVASITWRLILDGAAARMGGQKIRRLSTYTDTEKAFRLQHYTKVMFVREPILRALSGWYDKFVNGIRDEHSEYMGLYGCDIARRMRTNISTIRACQQSRGDGRNDADVGQDVLPELNIPFEDFARYLVSGPAAIRNDMHWDTYHSRCQPCQVQYDFIGHYETMALDADEIMRRVGLDGASTSSFRLQPSGSEDVARGILGDLDSVLLMRLHELYHLDYQLFGYDQFKLQEWADMVPVNEEDNDPALVEIGRPRN